MGRRSSPSSGPEGALERRLPKKNQNSINQDMEEKILSMCAKGINAREHISEYMPWKSQTR